MNLTKNNATCTICGNGYYMCLSCHDQMKLNPWKIHTDTSEHYKVFQILRGFSTGVYTKQEAANRLKNVDLSDMDSFKDNIKKQIKNILSDTSKPVSVNPVANNSVNKSENTDDSNNVSENSVDDTDDSTDKWQGKKHKR